MEQTDYPRRIGRRLVAVFVVFVALLIGASGWALYRTTRNSLDEELGHSLEAMARIGASQMNATIISSLQPGDEQTRTYANFVEKLMRIKAATHAQRVYVFDREHKLLLDTDPDARIGTRHIRLSFDRAELALVWAGASAQSVLFQGRDGRYYKSGYAPVLDGNRAVAGVGIDASAAFVETIRGFRHSVILFAAAGILITVIIGLVFAQTITRPIHGLVRAAKQISRGRLDQQIALRTRDELAYLADSLNQMRRSILQRDGQLKAMLASIAHEIRNPLGSIEIFAGLAADELSEDSPEKKHVSQIAQEARGLNLLLTEFLEFARPRQPEPRFSKLGDLVDEATFLVAADLEGKHIALHKDLSPDDARIYADPEQTKHIFINLFKNAVEAMEPGGKIDVRSRSSSEGILIEVEDTGAGIPPEAQGKVFEPFYSTKDDGVGLGLATVKKIVEDNKGRIELHSEVGKGTVFALSLPDHAPPAP